MKSLQFSWYDCSSWYYCKFVLGRRYILALLLSCAVFSPVADAQQKTSVKRRPVQAKASQPFTSSERARAPIEDLNRLPPPSGEIVIDTVLASIDGVPITLQEFSKHTGRTLTLEQVKSDASLRAMLDGLIMERIIEAEASNRKIKSNPDDIEKYVDQVAAQNNLSRPQFESALQEQGKSIEEFKKQARLEILRNRLMAHIAQNAPAVTDEELGAADEHIESEESTQQVRFRLREIFLPRVEGNDDELDQSKEKVESALEAGRSFASVASEFSRGPTASDGGDLGEVAEPDLSESIREEVADLSAGEHSEALDLDDGIHFFYLEQKFEEGESSGQERKELVRKELENRKLEKKFREFFEVELPRLHKVERKI